MIDNNIISSDHPLSGSQRQMLSAILDTLVPASEDGLMPGAGELDLAEYLKVNAADFLQHLPEIVDRFDAEFPTLQYPARYELVDKFRIDQRQLFEQLLFHTYAHYYQDDRVLTGIGSKAGPPFPQGNNVEPGDLSLLDPVVNLQRSYRK